MIISEKTSLLERILDALPTSIKEIKSIYSGVCPIIFRKSPTMHAKKVRYEQMVRVAYPAFLIDSVKEKRFLKLRQKFVFSVFSHIENINPVNIAEAAIEK